MVRVRCKDERKEIEDHCRFNTSVRYPLSRSILGIFRGVYYGNMDDGRKTGRSADEEEDRNGEGIEDRRLIHGVKYMK